MKKILFAAMLDEIERAILFNLAKDPSMEISTLADVTGYDRKTIRTRLKKLINYGVLSGYRQKINLVALGFHFSTITILENPARVTAVVDYLKKIPSVVQIQFAFSGKITAIVAYNTPGELDKFLNDLLENGTIDYSVEDNVYIVENPLSLKVLECDVTQDESQQLQENSTPIEDEE